MRNALFRMYLMSFICSVFFLAGCGTGAGNDEIYPTLSKVGEYSSSRSFIVRRGGDYIYLCSLTIDNEWDSWDTAIEIIDTHNPENLILMGKYSEPGRLTGVSFTDKLMYLTWNVNWQVDTFSSSGLSIIDIEDISNPYYKVSYLNPEAGDAFDNGALTAYDIIVNGNLAYMVSWKPGGGLLEVLDISNPEQPSPLGELNLVQDSYEMTLNGNFLYVVFSSSLGPGLLIIDISDSAQPILKYKYYLPDVEDIYRIFITDHKAYLPCLESGLKILDLSDPLYPLLLGSFPGKAHSVFVQGKYAFIAAMEEGLKVVNVSDPTKPILKAVYNESQDAEDIFVSGDYAYLADYNTGLHILDISDLP